MCGHDYAFTQAELDAFIDVGLLFQPLHIGGNEMNIMILANITKTELGKLTGLLKEACGNSIKVEFSKVDGDKYSIRCDRIAQRAIVGKVMDDFMTAPDAPEEPEPPVLDDLSPIED